MTAAEVLADPTRLAVALRSAAEGIPAYVAAVDLICESGGGHWLRSDAFRWRLTIDQDDDGNFYADVAWPTDDQIRELPDTNAEKAVLWVAASLATGWLGEVASSCDRRNIALVLDAIGTASGGSG